jgi:hypothetical protein
MSKCSPRYLDNGVIKNTERMWSPVACDCNCVHWRACWEELREGSKRVLPLMSLKQCKKLKGLYKPNLENIIDDTF